MLTVTLLTIELFLRHLVLVLFQKMCSFSVKNKILYSDGQFVSDVCTLTVVFGCSQDVKEKFVDNVWL